MATGKLTPLLNSMYSEAMIGQDARRTLGHGLRVGMRVMGYHVTIVSTCDDQYPSMQEWNTIIKFFPYETTVLEPPTTIRNTSGFHVRGVVSTQGMERLL